MKLATSRYHAPDLIVASGLAPVGITVSPPRWRLAYELAGNVGVLAPHGLLEVDDLAEFERRYRERLDRLGVEPIRALLAAFAAFSAENGCVLLCYEKDAELCHRRFFAQWWEERTGEHVPELGRPFRQPTIG
jgi:hypothetical protein